MASVGIQFGSDVLNPQMRRGGLRAYPFGQVLSGCTIATPTVAAGVVSISIAAGVVILDGQQYSTAPSTLVTSAYAVANGIRIPVFVSPVRRVECKHISTLVPSYGVNGDRAFSTVDIPATPDSADYQELQGVFVKRSGVWIAQNNKINPSEQDPIFTPPSTDHFSLPFNAISGGIYTLAEERIVLRRVSGYPEFAVKPGPSFARIGASVQLGTLRFDIPTLSTITNYTLFRSLTTYA